MTKKDDCILTVVKDWNPLQKRLSEAIKTKNIEEVKKVAITLHALAHDKDIFDIPHSFCNQILDGYRTRLVMTVPVHHGYKVPRTIAFLIYHITRIEDICANQLIRKDNQLFFSEGWQNKLNIDICDTGNSFNHEEMKNFNDSINIDALFDYRKMVALRTREIILNLSEKDITRKVNPDDIEKVRNTGSVLPDQESVWLLDYWGGKNVGGLLMMPITRHLIVHLNDCAEIIKSARKNKMI